MQAPDDILPELVMEEALVAASHTGRNCWHPTTDGETPFCNINQGRGDAGGGGKDAFEGWRTRNVIYLYRSPMSPCSACASELDVTLDTLRNWLEAAADARIEKAEEQGVVV